uniref:Uncharacterized protein n=1 Tax=Anguilla anguilla TaxID=7936 RepID=A0A0E9UXU2_ANGAN
MISEHVSGYANTFGESFISDESVVELMRPTGTVLSGPVRGLPRSLYGRNFS